MSAAALHRAVHAQLAGDPALALLVGGRIHDAVPSDPVWPYVAFGPTTARADGSKTAPGLAHRIDLHIWSRHRGRAEVAAILRAITDALDRVPLDLGAEASWRRGRVVETTADRRADGRTWRGTLRYEASTVANPAPVPEPEPEPDPEPAPEPEGDAP